jgi:hypothetical protein
MDGWMDEWMDGWFVGRWVNEQSPVYLPLRSGWLPTYLQDSFFATGSFTKAKLVYLGCYVYYLPTYLLSTHQPFPMNNPRTGTRTKI